MGHCLLRLMLGLIPTLTVATLAGCANAQVRPVQRIHLEPSAGDRSAFIVDASELAKAYGNQPKTIKVVNDGPGAVEVEVFLEPVGSWIDAEKAAEKRTLPAGSEESFQYPGFGSLLIVNRSDSKATVRVVH